MQKATQAVKTDEADATDGIGVVLEISSGGECTTKEIREDVSGAGHTPHRRAASVVINRRTTEILTILREPDGRLSIAHSLGAVSVTMVLSADQASDLAAFILRTQRANRAEVTR